MKHIFIGLILAGAVLVSCSPPSSNYIRQKPASSDYEKPDESEEASSNAGESQTIRADAEREGAVTSESGEVEHAGTDRNYGGIGKSRFEDTTVVVIRKNDPESARKAGAKIGGQFAELVENYERNADFDCSNFEAISETLMPGDSLAYAARFYAAECLAVNNFLAQAEVELKELADDVETPGEIREKALIRLGHVYCLQKKDLLAERAFESLRALFPNSKYLKTADCVQVRKAAGK